MTEQQKWVKKKLNIVACVEGYRGQGAKGEFVIYNITATDENGAVINQKLSSFSELPLGPGEFEVQPFYKDGELKNYTLRRPGGATGQLRAEVEELKAKVKWLEEQVNGLNAAINALLKNPPALSPQAPITPENYGQQRSAPVTVPPTSAPAYGAVPNDDDDIPF
jgi:hypothetical protein